MAHITSIQKTGAGHWLVTVERDNYSPKTRNWTSTTRWTYTTTDSMAIDAYCSDDEDRQRDGEQRLIWQAQTWGDKEIMKVGL